MAAKVEREGVSQVSFLLNGEPVTVADPDPRESLLSFLRRTARLKGTKALCKQGGCGSCTVLLSLPSATTLNPSSGECSDADVSHRAVNSCLRPLCSVDGLSVTTVEGVGSTKGGMHAVQKQMYDYNASQCGFCTPGFVMSMYSQMKHRGGALSAAEAEAIADGNICRCTGYRPILDAFQSLSKGPSCGDCKDSKGPSCGDCKDSKGLSCGDCKDSKGPQGAPCAPEIEDLCVSAGRCVKASVARGRDAALSAASDAASSAARGLTLEERAAALELSSGNSKANAVALEVVDPSSGLTWRTVATLEELFAAMQDGGKATRIVCGNTSTGVYPPAPASVLLDVSRVPELRTVKATGAGITLGGAVTLSELMETLQGNLGGSSSYAPLLKHLHRVANYQVRNVGSVVGNLMMTRQHPDFPSDVATLLCGCGASVAVAACGAAGESPVVRVDLLSFLRREAAPAGANEEEGVVVLSVHIPAVTKPSQRYLTYKVAQRAVNAHAIVNAAFTLNTDLETGAFLDPPLLVFGGLQPLPCRATQTEAFLKGKSAVDSTTIAQALDILAAELAPAVDSKKAAYRAMLARSFLYKALLSTVPEGKLPADLVTAVTPFERPISSGQVSFDDGDPSEYPVSKPLHKLSEALQVTGEATFLDDVDYTGDLHACYVQSEHANAAIAAIDASAALALEGVEAFFSAESVQAQGMSNAVSPGEELFASERVVYHGQPVGMVVATSQELAARAAALVQVSYSDMQPPLLTLDAAVAAGSFFEDRKRELKAGDMGAAMGAADVIVKGRSAVSHQYHFTTETQRAVTVPGENGELTVHSSTQFPSLVQSVVSAGVGVPQHKVKVVVKRVGGAYGSKLNRCAPVAMASAVAAKALGRPVRLVLDLTTNMQIVGGRSPYRYDYSVAVQKDGQITGIQMRVLNNHGAHPDFEYPEMIAFLLFIDNVYNIKTWDVEVQVARTNLPSCTWIRAPGNVESLFITETIIEHVAASLGLAPEAVRERNLYSPGDITVWGDKLTYCNARLVIDTIKASSGFDARLASVSSFNASSRWVKRGLCLLPIKYCIPWSYSSFLALVNVFPDGSVSVAHSGVEMGQGLEVKVAQVAAYALGVLASDGCPMEGVAVRATTTDLANNSSATGGSIGSELCCMATKGACDAIVERLKPVAALMRKGRPGSPLPTWQELIGQATAQSVDLQARHRAHPGASGHGFSQYCSFGAGVSEVEVDLLTGEHRILRSDVLLDCGKSLNPAIDIGQVQGAFVMGLGYLLTEEYDYDTDTGKLLTDSTWEYKPPSFADIPIDFRASLLQNSGNPYGFLRSKASGEPPLAMSCSALFAIRHALASGEKEIAQRLPASHARRESILRASAGDATEQQPWVALPAPATVERVCLTAGIPKELLTL